MMLFIHRFVTLKYLKAKENECSKRVFKAKSFPCIYGKVQVGNDQEKAQLERKSLSENRGGKKLN